MKIYKLRGPQIGRIVAMGIITAGHDTHFSIYAISNNWLSLELLFKSRNSFDHLV